MMRRNASRIVLACVVVLGSACSADVKDERVTEENKTTLFGQIRNSRDLTVEEVGLLQAFVVRNGLGDVLAGKTRELPVGMTIGDMIEDQRTWVADQQKQGGDEKERAARARAEDERLRQELLRAVTVTVVEKGFKSEAFQDVITFNVMYQNKSGKDIRGFKGSILFSDLFEVEITPFMISEDEPLASGATKRQAWTLKYNQFIDNHVKLRNTALDSLKIEWRPQVILFADGTSVEVKSAS
jgi:hypothetical protein